MYVYKTTCLINGKIYIGKQEHEYRNYLGSGVIIYHAIKKYGKENFEKEILEICQTKEELSLREAYWINTLKSYERDIGYNILRTAQFGNWLTNHPERESILRNHKLERRGYFRDKSGQNNPMWGKKHTDDTLRILKERARGRGEGAKNPRARVIYQYDVFGVLIGQWKCAKECVDFYSEQGIHISRGNLSSAAKFNTGRADCELKRTKNFVFSFEEIKREKFEQWKKKYHQKSCHHEKNVEI